MQTNKFTVIFITTITIISSTFCMEEHQEKYEKLEKLLKGQIVKTEDNIEYSTIDAGTQYEMLKTAIKNNDMQTLSLCLECKFNPNRYHKKLSPLHYAIRHHKSQAVLILSQYNPDLVPHNERGETPLVYAYNKDCKKCFDAMTYAIRKKHHELKVQRKHCGLTKHILKPGRCDKCIGDLSRQLSCYGLLEIFNSSSTSEYSFTSLNSDQ